MPRVLLTERSQQRHHFKPPERDRQIDAQPTARRHACTAEHPFGLLQIRQDAAAAIKKGRAVHRQVNAASGARQQPHPEPILQPANRVADARLGDAELQRRSGDNIEGLLRAILQCRNLPPAMSARGHSRPKPPVLPSG